MTEDPIVCTCNDVRRSSISFAIKEKDLKTVDQVSNEFKLPSACETCREDVQQILNEVKGN